MKPWRLLTGLAVLLVALGVAAQPADGRTPLPTIPAAKQGTQCIAPPEQMRREHMNMLQHQRDQTVRGGIRGAKASLQACISCHAGAETRSVASSPGDFCISCHSYAAVKIDCFECHSARPKGAMPPFHASLRQGAPDPLEQRLRQQLRSEVAR